MLLQGAVMAHSPVIMGYEHVIIVPVIIHAGAALIRIIFYPHHNAAACRLYNRSFSHIPIDRILPLVAEFAVVPLGDLELASRRIRQLVLAGVVMSRTIA